MNEDESTDERADERRGSNITLQMNGDEQTDEWKDEQS